MATLVLQAAGQAIGGSLLGGLGGIIGSAAGAVAGYAIDNALFGSAKTGAASAQLPELSVQTSTEGTPIPRVYGRARIAGQIIWATDFDEVVDEQEQGGKGGGQTATSYTYYANFAVGLCEGRVDRIGRIWADGNPLDQSLYDFRIHKGAQNMAPDPLIEAIEGADAAPAYQDTAYVVFERLPLADFGNRLPQLTFEVIRVIDRLETMVSAVTVIPGSTEFGYHDRQVTRRLDPGEVISENRHTGAAETDWAASIDELTEICPNLKSVALVAAWFGTDLRCGQCVLKPGVEELSRKIDGATWSVASLQYDGAHLVSRVDGRPAYGGTPSDETVVAAIKDLKARGLRVVFYPFIMMDVEKNNSLPDPYGGTGQAPYPWRGRITCHPAPGEGGSPDKSANAATQVANFVGAAEPQHFSISGETVNYSGAPEWSYRRLILHYAHLCKAAGGVDTFLIGAEMRGLTQIRSSASNYPFVNALVNLAADVKSVLGSGTNVTYGADWSEYFGHQPQDGTGDVRFHLDPLWSSPSIDIVGIDNYMPLADWRDGDHPDIDQSCSIYDLDYLRANIAGGEGFDWFYPTLSARRNGNRTSITDGAHGKPWVFRYKDLVSWWSNMHYDRPGGVEAPAPTAWVPESKPIWFTELGCPAIDRGANQPNVFYDPKSSESFFPYFSSGRRDDYMQRRFLEAVLSYWDPNDPDHVSGSNPVSSVYGARMLSHNNIHIWTWDARPFPAFPALTDIWSDGGNWFLGHWLTGRLGGVTLQSLIKTVLREQAFYDFRIDDVPGAVDGYIIGEPVSARAVLEPLAGTFRFVAVDTGRELRFSGLTCSAKLSISAQDLAVDTDDAKRMTITRGQETELPQEIRISYFDSSRDGARGSAAARRTAAQSQRITESALGVVASPSLMNETAEIKLHDLWSGRERFEFTLARRRAEVETGDVVSLEYGGQTRPIIIERLDDAGQRKAEARSVDPSVFRPAPAPVNKSRTAKPTIFGTPTVAFLDLPVFDPDIPHHRPRIAVYAKPWPGSMALWRSTTGASFQRISIVENRASIGEIVTPLAPGPVGHWDRTNSPRIKLYGGSLSSRSDLDVFSGANSLAVKCANGGWEILQFATAELVAEKTYQIRDLLRAQLGTEDAMMAGINVGATCVVLNGAVQQFRMRGDERGMERIYRIGPSRRNIAHAAMLEVTFAGKGRGIQPLSPVHLRACRDYSSGDIALSWIRRTRIDGDSWEGPDVPLGEAVEKYQADILNGGSVIRTIDTEMAEATYSSADQIDDFGNLPATIRFRVTQLAESAIGISREATLNV